MFNGNVTTNQPKKSGEAYSLGPNINQRMKGRSSSETALIVSNSANAKARTEQPQSLSEVLANAKKDITTTVSNTQSNISLTTGHPKRPVNSSASTKNTIQVTNASNNVFVLNKPSSSSKRHRSTKPTHSTSHSESVSKKPQ